MGSSSRIEIEKFNGKNFELWKIKMEDLLIDKKEWIIVDPGTQPTGTPSTSTQATGTQPTSTQTTSTPEGRLGQIGQKSKEYYLTLPG
jgi:hypothetical protein